MPVDLKAPNLACWRHTQQVPDLQKAQKLLLLKPGSDPIALIYLNP
jgi:hypothetical protein